MQISNGWSRSGRKELSAGASSWRGSARRRPAHAASLVGGASPAGAQKKVTVTMWDTEPNPATRAAVKAIVEDFQKLHKDIEVRAEGMGWGDMDRKLQAAMAAKSPPTASHTQTYVVTSFRAKGLIEPVDDVVKAIGEDKIFPSVLRWLKYPDGKYWGITHAWGAEILGGRGDYAQAAGRRSAELEDLGRLAARPAQAQQGARSTTASSLAGIPFFVNEDVYMWAGSNGGSLFDAKGQPGAGEPPGARDARVLEEAQAVPAAGLGLARLSRDALGVGHRQDGLRCACGAGPRATSTSTRRPTSATPTSSRSGPRPSGPMGKAPLTQFDNEPWVIYADAPADEKAACREFLKFFFKPENYRKYCDSVPVHILSIFKADFQDPSYLDHPERKRWKPWLDAQLKWVEMGRAHPLLVCNPQDMLVPWIGDVAAAPILADMVMAVVERGKDPKAAAKEASDKIVRDIIGKAK